MKALTLEYVKENMVDYREMVRYFKPDISIQEADSILFDETYFPLHLESTIKQLNKLFLNEEIKKRESECDHKYPFPNNDTDPMKCVKCDEPRDIHE